MFVDRTVWTKQSINSEIVFKKVDGHGTQPLAINSPWLAEAVVGLDMEVHEGKRRVTWIRLQEGLDFGF